MLDYSILDCFPIEFDFPQIRKNLGEMTPGQIGVSYPGVAGVLGWTPCTSTEIKRESPHSVRAAATGSLQ